MSIEHSEKYWRDLLDELRKLPKETEWVELKQDNKDPMKIGEYISALSNSAALNDKLWAYLVWGIEDATHNIVGTTFNPETAKKGNEELENWLYRLLSPNIHFVFHELNTDEGKVVILEIEKASHKPIQFNGVEYIRIGSYNKKLKEYTEKERALWKIFEQIPFENLIAADHLSDDEILNLLDYRKYFELFKLRVPEDRKRILERFSSDNLIEKCQAGGWNITNFGAILFAKQLSDFKHLKRKSVRVITYAGNSRMDSAREQEGIKGYASGFEGLINFIDRFIPRNEIIGKALRQDLPMYPEEAVRELVANAIIHQDFYLSGTGPMIEIFLNRMEITNPGIPLVKTERFLDSPPRSRNEILASFMRRIGICEERGTGFDKVVFQTEFYQLPPPVVEVTDEHTRVTLFAQKPFNKMDKNEKILACYLHACLKYVNKEGLTNTSLRKRFGIEEKNSSIVSRIIRDTIDASLIKLYDSKTAQRYWSYVPFWA